MHDIFTKLIYTADNLAFEQATIVKYQTTNYRNYGLRKTPLHIIQFSFKNHFSGYLQQNHLCCLITFTHQNKPSGCVLVKPCVYDTISPK